MKFTKLILISFLLIFFSIISFAKEQEIELHIANMTCPSCPIIVKKTLQKVDGVKEVETNYSNRTATVIFDDSKTNQDLLMQATKNQGYPSEICDDDNSIKC
jgi:mercuric ion binding protein